MKNTTIPALFFADDIVLIAQSEEELALKILITHQFMKERKLEVNFEKSAVIGVGKVEEKEWVVQDGSEVQKLRMVNAYKYLGTTLGRNRIMYRRGKRY